MNADALAVAFAAVRRQLPGTVPDGWLPAVQGAVGHVAGMRAADGTPLVVKVYAAQGARDRLRTELLALSLARPVVPVPTVVLHSELADRSASGFVLMTRLPGARWADLRPQLDTATSSALAAQTGRLLRRLHAVRGARFGDLLAPGFTTAWERVAGRRESALAQYLRSGGSARIAGRVTQFVDAARSAIESCSAPALCHHDVIDGNLLLTGATRRQITGLVDLERATWDDPLSDLAQTRVHVEFHRPADVAPLLDAYGPRTPDEHRRLDVHDVLHRVRERARIATDRPAGWEGSVAALDAAVDERTR